MTLTLRPIAPLLLLAITAQAAQTTRPADADNPYAALVHQLGDRDPAVRKSAYNELSAAADAARPALREAMHSARPAVVDAATQLLLHANWFTEADPLPVQNQLRRYGSLQPDQRASVLKILMTNFGDAGKKAALRVSQQEPADSVVWKAFDGISLDEAWRPLLAAKNNEPIPPAVLIARARGLETTAIKRAQQRAAGLGLGNILELGGAVVANNEITALIEQALAQEQEHPSATAAQLYWAVNHLVSHYEAAGKPAKAAEKLRLLVGRGSTQAIDPNTAILLPSDGDEDPNGGIVRQLLQLQATYGPLPGLDRDIAAAGDDDTGGRAALAIGAIAQRLGDTTAARMIFASQLADLPGESDADRAERLFGVAQKLIRLGMSDVAQTALERVVAIDQPGLDTITNAYLRLCDIYSASGDAQLAGDCLQRALDRTPAGGMTITRANGKQEPWSKEEVQGKIAWLYLVAARKKNDTAEIKKQATAVLESGSTDGEVFLDTLPTLEGTEPHIADKEVVDAYFDRVYAKAAERLAASPGDAMEMNDVAWLCSRAGRKLDEALKLATRAVAAKPDEAAYIDTLADAKFRSGLPAEALALELRASSMLPDNVFMKEQVERFKKAAATQP